MPVSTYLVHNTFSSARGFALLWLLLQYTFVGALGCTSSGFSDLDLDPTHSVPPNWLSSSVDFGFPLVGGHMWNLPILIHFLASLAIGLVIVEYGHVPASQRRNRARPVRRPRPFARRKRRLCRVSSFHFKKVFWVYLIISPVWLPPALAATDPCGEVSYSHPSEMLHNAITLYHEDAADEADQLLDFLFHPEFLDLEPDDWISMHNHRVHRRHRVAAVPAFHRDAHVRIMELLWPDIAPGTLRYAEVRPTPIPRDMDYDLAIHYLVWDSLFPVGQSFVLVDFTSRDWHLDCFPLYIPIDLQVTFFLERLRLRQYCQQRPSPCRLRNGLHDWSVHSHQPVYTPIGTYIRVDFLEPVGDMRALWSHVTRPGIATQARSPSRSPRRPPHAGQRIGEASNPGPPFWLGVINPSGLRGKEHVVATLPDGIWALSETHLSGITQRSVVKTLQAAYRQASRSATILPGAPVALRARSSSAGTWAGVMLLSQSVAKPLRTPWKFDEFGLGRVHLAQFWTGASSIVGTVVYGWPRGPTWPRATEATHELLKQLTQEITISRAGLRFVAGDFNQSESSLPCLEIWAQHGWFEVQSWAFQKLGRVPTPTSKKSSFVDKIFLSPEFLPYIQQVDTWGLFPDHDVLGCQIELPATPMMQCVWPLPAEVPWNSLRFDDWMTQATCRSMPHGNIDEQFNSFCQQYEDSFTGHLATPGKRLPPTCDPWQHQQSGLPAPVKYNRLLLFYVEPCSLGSNSCAGFRTWHMH